MLVQQGKLRLEDDIRKYVPEIPDYGSTITIRHLLTHTSGLRDWGNVESIAGWPRTTRVYTHDHVLDILSRQRGVNFVPGNQYSYSNSGYNLLVIIVSRVSGMPFAEFSATSFSPHASMNASANSIVEATDPARHGESNALLLQQAAASKFAYMGSRSAPLELG